MRLKPTGEARYVVNDDDMRITAMLLQEGQHCHHAETASVLPGHVVAEHLDDLQILIRRVLPAAMLLTFQTVTLSLLLSR